MDISILICTRNRATQLKQTLESLSQIEVPVSLHCECIIVDNASHDDTPCVITESQLPFEVRTVREPTDTVSEEVTGLSKARNAALLHARGEIFLWTDDDVRVPVNWIAGMTAPILRGTAEAVAGGVRLAPHLQKPWMEIQHRNFIGATTELLDAIAPNQMIGANMAFSRRVLARVPAYDPELGAGALGGGEETLFSWQVREAGFRIVSAFDVRVEHHFEEARLSKQMMLETTRSRGRSAAYIAYHWLHEEKIAAAEKTDIARRIWRPLYWTYRRIKDRLHNHPFPIWELNQVHDAAFREQYEFERQRPRNYEKRGLVKLSH